MTPQDLVAWGTLLGSIQTTGHWILAVLLTIGLGGLFFVVKGFTKYSEKVGEIDAISDKFEELKEQLRQNTEVVAKVNASATHDDWAMREWKTLRRNKLEVLLTKVYEVLAWHDHLAEKYVYGRAVLEIPSPFPQIEVISKLYFPEISALMKPYRETNSEIYTFILKRGLLINEVDKRIASFGALETDNVQAAKAEKMALINEFGGQKLEILKRHLEAARAIQNKAREIFSDAFIPGEHKTERSTQPE